MFLYNIFKPLIFIFLRIYYRIQVKGIKNIPYGKPVILSPNHVNAFVDPIVLASMIRQTITFFARSDVFKTKIAKIVLGDFNIKPMYRIQEGYSNLKHNNKTFEECKRLLGANKTILMFPEGICIMENRLRKLKKGLSRIIFDTEESFNFKKEVWVVPIGLNYSCAHKFGSKFYVNIGKAIHISDYNNLYKTDKVRAINAFTGELEEKMRELLIHINNPANDRLFDLLSEIYTAEKIFNSKNKSLENEYEQNKKLVAAINNHDVSDLHTKADAYAEALNKHNIKDNLLYKNKIESLSPFKLVLKTLLLFVGLPFFLVGIITNYLPFFIAGKFAEKKVKNIEFFASIYLTFAMIGWLLFYGAQLICIGLIFRNWLWLADYAVGVILTGIITIPYYRLFEELKSQQALLKLTRKSPVTVTDLLMKRMEIIELTEKMVIRQ